MVAKNKKQIEKMTSQKKHYNVTKQKRKAKSKNNPQLKVGSKHLYPPKNTKIIKISRKLPKQPY